jgi:hypothetical protein
MMDTKSPPQWLVQLVQEFTVDVLERHGLDVALAFLVIGIERAPTPEEREVFSRELESLRGKYEVS